MFAYVGLPQNPKDLGAGNKLINGDSLGPLGSLNSLRADVARVDERGAERGDGMGVPAAGVGP